MAQPLASQTPQEIIAELGRKAKNAAATLNNASTDVINAALGLIADNLRVQGVEILAANQKDLAAAQAKRLSPALIDRLTLNAERIEAMAKGVENVRALPDPVGRILWETTRPNGLKIQRVSVPIGVLGMIYESRPNVTVDAAVLSLKSHNAVILRGGSESFFSSQALAGIVRESLEKAGLPADCVSMVPVSDRDAVGALLAATDYVDVIIPRGGRGLIERVMAEARMPVFGHLEGLCHLYIHPSAKPEIAREVTLNAKMRRTGICGALETLLLDEKLDPAVARDVLEALSKAGCVLVGDKKAQALIPGIGVATAEDWVTEYLDAKLSVAVVGGTEAAIVHINTYGSHHTDSILAEDKQAVEDFLKNVDSGIVLHNASTQFADGGEFGMGAEIGIATGKMHARGPVGLEQLCTYKYLVHGTGQTRP